MNYLAESYVLLGVLLITTHVGAFVIGTIVGSIRSERLPLEVTLLDSNELKETIRSSVRRVEHALEETKHFDRKV